MLLSSILIKNQFKTRALSLIRFTKSLVEKQCHLEHDLQSMLYERLSDLIVDEIQANYLLSNLATLQHEASRIYFTLYIKLKQ